MTLTVRLKPALESALELHCAERGVTKSLVVQEVLAEYLARPDVQRSAPPDTAGVVAAEPSANYRAFEALGLIGCMDGVGPADKAGVRAAFRRRADAKRAAHEARGADDTAASARVAGTKRRAVR